MQFIDLWEKLDPTEKIWLNFGDYAEKYICKRHIPLEYDKMQVEYITLDCENILTIELKEA